MSIGVISVKNKDYWEKHYAETTSENNPNLVFFKSFIETYKDQISSPVLDLGCGDGRLLNILYKKGVNDLFGVDFSENAVSLARNKFSQIDFLLGDIYNLGNLFEENFFSLITSSMSLHHESYADSKHALLDWSSILKKEGLLYLLTRSDSSLRGNEPKIKESTYFLEYIGKNRVHFNRHSLEAIIPLELDILEFGEVKYFGRSGAPIASWKVILKKR